MRTTDGAGLWRAVRWAGRPLARLVRRTRRRHELREALRTIRAARDVRLVLIYHRIAPRDAPRYEIVPTVPHDLFRQHLTALGELGQVLPLDRLLADHDDGGLRLAVTFDDDYATHLRYVLPVLSEFGLNGTFFLSGRALHGLSAYWFERLEALVEERGLSAAAALLSLEEVREPAHLPLLCEGDVRRQALIDQHAPPADPPLSRDGIRTLAESGMTIGFHTLHHPVLPGLPDDTLRPALVEGREGLEACVGRSIQWFAYPHGKVDERILALMPGAGYTAAWTTQPRLLRSTDDSYQYGRWDPLPMSTDGVLIRLGRLLRQARS